MGQFELPRRSLCCADSPNPAPGLTARPKTASPEMRSGEARWFKSRPSYAPVLGARRRASKGRRDGCFNAGLEHAPFEVGERV